MVSISVALLAIAAAIAILGVIASSLGESFIASKAIEGISRNPEATDKIRTNMIIAMSIVETGAIYSLVISLLIIFFLGAM